MNLLENNRNNNSNKNSNKNSHFKRGKFNKTRKKYKFNFNNEVSLEDSNDNSSKLPFFNGKEVLIDDNEIIFHFCNVNGQDIGLKVLKQSDNSYSINWVDFTDKVNLTVAVNKRNPMTVKNKDKDKELLELLTKINNDINIDSVLKKFDEVGIYISNNNPFEYNPNLDNNDVKVKISDLRKKPEYEKSSVDSFREVLAIDYDNDILSYVKDKSQYLILFEENNLCKQILLFSTVILGRQGFLDKVQGHSDTGKSYLLDCSLQFIPNLYILDLNNVTEASFIDEAINDSRCYDRVLINLGDLGDEKRCEKLMPIFDIIKIIITEKHYVSRKKEQKKEGNWETKEILIEGIIGALFSTVDENIYDKTSQLESRTISSTPVNNAVEDKLNFMQNSKLTGTSEHFYHNKTLEDLKEFQEFLKYKVVKYEENKDNLVVVVPFIKTLDKISSNRSTVSREVKQLLTMMETYTILNFDRSFKITKTINGKKILYLIPRVEDFQNFININFDSVGLPPHEKNIILKLKKELELKTLDEIDEILIELSKEFPWMDNKDISELISSSELINNVLNKYELSRINRRRDKHGSEEIRSNFVFFTASEFKMIFKNHKAVKDIKDVNSLIRKLVDKGFINKLDAKKGNHNIYYLDESVNQVYDEYSLSVEDIDNAIDSLRTNFKLNPMDKDSGFLFTDSDLKDILDNYEDGI